MTVLRTDWRSRGQPPTPPHEVGLAGKGLLFSLALPPFILVPGSTIKALGLSILLDGGEGDHDRPPWGPDSQVQAQPQALILLTAFGNGPSVCRAGPEPGCGNSGEEA